MKTQTSASWPGSAEGPSAGLCLDTAHGIPVLTLCCPCAVPSTMAGDGSGHSGAGAAPSWSQGGFGNGFIQGGEQGSGIAAQAWMSRIHPAGIGAGNPPCSRDRRG